MRIKGRKIIVSAAALVMSAAFFFSAPVNAAEEELAYADGSSVVLQAGGLLPEEELGRAEAPQYLAEMSDTSRPAVKQYIRDRLLARDSQINISSYGIPKEGLPDFYFSMLNDYPELFFVDNYISYSPSGIYYPRYNDYTEADVARFEEVTDEIIAQAPAGMNEKQKLLWVHDYIVTHCEYDMTLSKFNAYNVLVEKTAVCQGYALAFRYLTAKLGVDAQLVTSKSMNHAWNLVKLDGSYYHIDCTWDDPSNSWYEAYCAHKNFMRSEDKLVSEAGHSGSDWTSGDLGNVNGLATSTLYDDYFWHGVTTAIPMAKGYYAYVSSTQFILRKMDESDYTYVTLVNDKAPWWYTTVATDGSSFYYNTRNALYQMKTDLTVEKLYDLTTEEKAIGNIYGMIHEDGALAYNLGTSPCNTTFTRNVYELPAESSEDTVLMHSALATFEGKIGVVFRLALPEAVKADPNAYAVLSKAGKETKIKVSDALVLTENGQELHCFTQYVVAREYRENINLKLFYGNGTPVTVKGKSGTDYTTGGVDYSLETYVSRKKTSSDAKMAALAVALEDYCTAAQIYFEYNAAGLSVSDQVKNVTAAQLEGFKGVFDGSYPAGMKGRSITATFESDNSFVLFYTFNDGVDPYGYQYTINGQAANLGVSDGKYLLMVSNVPARSLDKVNTYTISNGSSTYTVKCSVLTYARSSVLNGTEARQNLGKALYLYNQAAKAYFE